jgi:hypothetical protein
MNHIREPELIATSLTLLRHSTSGGDERQLLEVYRIGDMLQNVPAGHLLLQDPHELAPRHNPSGRTTKIAEGGLTGTR